MPPALYVVLRFLWFLLSRIIIWAAAAGLVVLAFFMAMDYMNTSTLTKDGMQVRAEVIIKGSDPSTLSKVFSKSFLQNDTILNSDLYQPYKVSDFDYDASASFALIFPWQNSVTLTVTEKISNIVAQVTPDTDSGLRATPPLWKNAVYDVTLVRYEDNWRIFSMKTIQVLPSATPSAAPSVSLTPSASLAPSPSASESQ